MDEATHKQMVFESERKSVGIAYLLWFLLGGFGAHRLYAGKTKTGVTQLLLLLSIVGWLVLFPWLLVDLALIPGIIRERNMKTIEALHQGSRRLGPAEPARRMATEADRKREAMLEDLRSIGYRKERRDSSHLYR